jgi:hypothetical protein
VRDIGFVRVKNISVSQETGCEDVNWIQPAQLKIKWRSFVNIKIMSLNVPWETFLIFIFVLFYIFIVYLGQLSIQYK